MTSSDASNAPHSRPPSGPPPGSDDPGSDDARSDSGRTPNRGRRLLITAGPTQEPIDAVRYIGNRSSGRVGIALAEKAAQRGWRVTLLLGPTALEPRPTSTGSHLRVRRFRTTADLQSLLGEEWPIADVLVMAAAVADFRPRQTDRPDAHEGKIRRSDAGLKLDLEPTPDLTAACHAVRTPGQRIVGFALEPRERVLDSARAKIARKGLDLIVANPLETMDDPAIEAVLLSPRGEVARTPGRIPKEDFGAWLLERLEWSLDHEEAAPAPQPPPSVAPRPPQG